jgi:hypothetical protein
MVLPDIELVAEKIHGAWVDIKRANGVSTRLSEDGEEYMVPYGQLSEKAKNLDRSLVKTVYEAIECIEETGIPPFHDCPNCDGCRKLSFYFCANCGKQLRTTPRY